MFVENEKKLMEVKNIFSNNLQHKKKNSPCLVCSLVLLIKKFFICPKNKNNNNKIQKVEV